MLAEMSQQAVEIYNGNRIREFDGADADLVKGLSRRSRSKKSIP